MSYPDWEQDSNASVIANPYGDMLKTLGESALISALSGPLLYSGIKSGASMYNGVDNTGSGWTYPAVATAVGGIPTAYAASKVAGLLGDLFGGGRK